MDNEDANKEDDDDDWFDIDDDDEIDNGFDKGVSNKNLDKPSRVVAKTCICRRSKLAIVIPPTTYHAEHRIPTDFLRLCGLLNFIMT